MLQRLVVALNSVGSQPTALVVLWTGCLMYFGSKHFGLDVSVPAGIVGAAINMLTGHTSIKTETTQPADGSPSTVIQSTESPAPSPFLKPESK